MSCNDARNSNAILRGLCHARDSESFLEPILDGKLALIRLLLSYEVLPRRQLEGSFLIVGEVVSNIGSNRQTPKGHLEHTARHCLFFLWL